jgi:Domain of Unknown Function (DUF1206)
MSATYTMRRAAKSETLGRLARLGLAARASIYLLIGALAVAVAFGRSTSETDQRGAMQDLNRHAFGHLILWVIAVGLAAYALWRFSEAAFGVVGDGRDLGPRVKSFVRGCIYAFFALSAFQIALGQATGSQAGQQENISAQVMRHSGGRVAVGILGAVVVAVGVALVIEGLTHKFERYLDESSMTPETHRIVKVLGVIGTAARGAVFALAGVFVIQAAWDYQPQKAAGLDGALRSLRDTAAGPWLLGVVAVGLVAFGLYGFAEARWRRT